jgi:hypothetical protein
MNRKFSLAITIFLAAASTAFAQTDYDARASLAIAAACKMILPCDCGGACGCPVCDCIACKHVKQRTQEPADPWYQATLAARSLDWPIMVWRNYSNPHMKANLGQFTHYETRSRNEFGGGVGVTIVYRKPDGYWYSRPSLRIAAGKCSLKAIRDVWDKHNGVYKGTPRASMYQSSPAMMYSAPMMQGGYGGGMMYQSAPRRMFGGRACST